jgi:zinc transport system substrate-binding protein
MEQPLTKALATLAPQAQTLPLIESAGLVLINFDKVTPAHEKHDHEKHDHEKHDHEKHDHEKHDHEKHDKHDEHAKHDDHLINPHIWLDPQNAKIMLGVIAARLAKADPENASTYAANADSMAARLATLETDITSQLASYSAAKFLVLHDAHVYFERRFGLRNYGAITTEPDVMPTASRVKALRDELREHRFDCIFTEPFLGQKAVALIAEGSKVSIGTLDPIASNLPAGAQLYPDLLMSYAKALQSCFGVH